MSNKPNFLLIMTDQQCANWMGCAGHPIVKTPNIDAIAENGTRFTDFHVALPVCMPNRAALMTGRMPTVNRVRYNGVPLPLEANTFVDVLAADGYRTASIGKSHLQPFTKDAPIRKPDPIKRLIPEAWKTDQSDYYQEHPSAYESEDTSGIQLPYYGFEHVEMATGHGVDCGGHYGQWFRKTFENWREMHDAENELPHNYTCPQAFRTPVPEDAHPTTWIADRAVDYLNRAGDEENPFFAFVSFSDPHHPFHPPGKYWDMYSPDQFEVDLPYDAHKNPPPPLQALTKMWESGEGQRIPQMSFRADDQHVKEAMALTAGMITMIDDQIGRIVKTLKETGQYENTVIIFTSDHGDYMGAFNLLLKGPLQHHSITRVPFIWSDPKDRSEKLADGVASTIDISSSVLDRAQLAPYFGIQGKSFLKTIEGDQAHRDSVFIEHNDNSTRMGFEKPARARTVRTADWRMTLYAGEGWGELYDIKSDPDETENLWSSQKYAIVKADLMETLAEYLSFQTDESPRPDRLA